MCMQNLIYDLIIGNIPGVRAPEVSVSSNEGEMFQSVKERKRIASRKTSKEINKDIIQSGDQELQSSYQIEEGGAVKTRAQVATEHEKKRSL